VMVVDVMAALDFEAMVMVALMAVARTVAVAGLVAAAEVVAWPEAAMGVELTVAAEVMVEVLSEEVAMALADMAVAAVVGWAPGWEAASMG